MKKDPYKCCRCGYTSPDKACMRRHLFASKKPCPGLHNDIELTTEIKESILNNRIYHYSENNITTIHQTINNINTVNNFIANMNPFDKINRYLEHKGIDLIEFEQSVEDKYKRNAKRLEKNGYKFGFKLKTQDFLEIIDEISNVSARLDEFNILYDTKLNKVKLYEAGVWEAMLVESGITKIIQTIQVYYLDSYESYLIRNIMSHDIEMIKRQEYRELLDEYYKFLACFDITPFIKGKANNHILYNESDERYSAVIDVYNPSSYSIEEEFTMRYKKMADSVLKSEANNIKRKILDIIKRNTSQNVDEINKKLIELFNMDETFKKVLLL
jgi:hypothetical protein